MQTLPFFGSHGLELGCVIPRTCPQERGTVLLDGRNRARACELAGVNVQTRWYSGGDPIGFSISQNMKRRHLTTGQKAAVADSAEPLFAAEAKRKETLRKMGITDSDATGADLHQSDSEESPSTTDSAGASEETAPKKKRAPRAADRAAKTAGTSGQVAPVMGSQQRAPLQETLWDPAKLAEGVLTI